MKQTFLILLVCGFFSCNQDNGKIQILQNRVDSLQSILADSYKPGFGEFMSSIQVHHNKLWFAGKDQNWQLAAFEINEIQESLDDIKKYCTDRPETNSLGMIDQPLQNLNKAIIQKNSTKFNDRYTILTTTCNTCHQETQHGFNVITKPTTPPFSNQDFEMQNKK
ncbi:MAG: hypothetical protein ABI653_04140 [Bacteroidota bacterium]